MDNPDTARTPVRDEDPLRPGRWLSLKAYLPNHDLLRPVYDHVEQLLYAERGVPLWLGDHCVRCAVNAAPRFTKDPDHHDTRQLMARLFEELRPGDLFLDVGGHHGLSAIAAALRVGETGRVLAFEWRPGRAATLARNVSLNALSERIEIHEAAVWSSHHGEEPLNRVRMTSLDYYLEPRRRTFANIDAGGHEIAVLRSAVRLLASDAVIFLALRPSAWESNRHATWDELQSLARTHRRTVQLLDGRSLEAPARRRVELTLTA